MKTKVLILLISFAMNFSFADEEAIIPIPLKKPLTELEFKKALLGEKLFMDKRLSKNNSVSCMSCHDVYQGGADGKIVSTGIEGRQGSINSPTVINSSLNFRQFWDGRSHTLKDQVEGPIHHPNEMGSTWHEITKKLNADQKYVNDFAEVYQQPISSVLIKDALIFYEGTLIASDSRFDQFLRGNKNAITKEEKIGYEKFKTFGCISCHQGANVGGNMYQTMGVAKDYFKNRGFIKEADLGLYNVTKDENDKHVFRVPSLRNVVLTPPYFHDGSAKTIEEAVKVMGLYQLGRTLTKDDIDSIVKFLGTLKGTQPTPLAKAKVRK